MTTLAALAAAVGLDLATPAAVCAVPSAAWTAHDAGATRALSVEVDARLQEGLRVDGFGHSRDRFNGEWALGAFAMAAVGFSQAARADPDRAAIHLASTRRALDGLLTPSVRSFDAAAWSHDPLALAPASSPRDEPDHAVLGYVGVALGAARLADPAFEHVALHDAIAAALARRLSARAPGALLETYPGEAYPVDNAAVVAALALHAEATGAPWPAGLRSWLDAFAAQHRDPATGLLVQAVQPTTGAAIDHPRGSGTALAAWFLGFADPALSTDLARATRDHLGVEVAGFSAVREYPSGVVGAGDVDSGPLVFGLSISASGFSLGAAQAARDAAWLSSLLETACLFAAEPGERRPSATAGGVLGDAILLAMLTTPGADARPSARGGERAPGSRTARTDQTAEQLPLCPVAQGCWEATSNPSDRDGRLGAPHDRSR